jgi:hypothetical protein
MVPPILASTGGIGAPMADLTRRLVAVFAADVEGYRLKRFIPTAD